MTDENNDEVVSLLREIAERLASIDTKLSKIEFNSDIVARSASPLGRSHELGSEAGE
jgi:hypothetical protein